MKKYARLALPLIGLAFIFACGGSEPQASRKAAAIAPAAVPEQQPVRVKPVVEVPDSVKGKWKGIEIIIEDKDKKTKKETLVRLGEVYRVPASDMTIELKTFLPAFVMQGMSISSTSNEPSNPAAQVVVMDGGSEIFKGWLFARYPETHAFSHPRFAITLKEGAPNQ